MRLAFASSRVSPKTNKDLVALLLASCDDYCKNGVFPVVEYLFCYP